MSQVKRYRKDGIFYEEIDGVLRRQIPDGDGVSRYWHANGNLEREVTFINGKVEGIVYEWHDNGKLAREEPYKDGHVDGTVRQWNRAGTILGQYEMKMGNGVRRKWNDDGSPSLEIEELAEGFSRGKVWDDLGRGREVFLRNGKPISKKKFYERLEQTGWQP